MNATGAHHHPLLMVAPNGARRTKDDHSALPISIAQITTSAKACFEAGAGALHAHVRDADGHHTLDAGLYAELLTEMAKTVPLMPVQITTEAASRYAPPEQRTLVDLKNVRALSAALREITADEDIAAQRRFYHLANEREIDLQHILYAPEEVDRLSALVAGGIIPANGLSLLFVLGQYTPRRSGKPGDLAPFIQQLRQSDLHNVRFMVCAFGNDETACLVQAAKSGGDCRVGFENNLHHPDGSLASNNASRVAEVFQTLAKADI